MNIRGRATSAAWVATACAAAVLLVAGCSTFVEGRALSMLNDPFRVGDLPATSGPSGPRPERTGADGQGGQHRQRADRQAGVALDQRHRGVLEGRLQPVSEGQLQAGRQVRFLRLRPPQQSHRLPPQDLQVRQRLLQQSMRPDRLGPWRVVPARATLFRRHVRHRGAGPRVRPRAATDGETGLDNRIPPSSSNSRPIVSRACICTGWPPASRRASR